MIERPNESVNFSSVNDTVPTQEILGEDRLTEEEFIHTVINTLQDYLPEEVRDLLHAEYKCIVKVNDVKLHGACLRTIGEEIAPTIYLAPFYSVYLSGVSLERIMSEFAQCCIKACSAEPSKNALRNLSMENTMLAVRVVEAVRNREYLQDVPSIEVAPGLQLICDLRVPGGDEGQYRTKVTQAIFETLHMDEKTLFEEALRGSMEMDPPVLSSLEDSMAQDSPVNLLGEKTLADSDDAAVYVLSTTNHWMGATALFYPGVAQRIYNLLDGSYYALPTSLHEFLIIPMRNDFDIDSLEQMLRDANGSVVSEADVLSDDLFYFNTETMAIDRCE